MTRLAAEPRDFIPGTTGWTAADLDDPRIEREWFRGRYEIIEGVLTTMPAAYFDAQFAVLNLIFLLKTHLRKRRQPAAFAQEVDIVVDPPRVVRADAVYLTPADRKLQAAAARREGRTDLARTRILVPPTLVIESISPGHEDHDGRLKKGWYAQFNVPHYWLLNAFERSLRCLRLRGGVYDTEVVASGTETFTSSLFPGLQIDLDEVWDNLDTP
jgi:Uma2 family endonuclease